MADSPTQAAAAEPTAVATPVNETTKDVVDVSIMVVAWNVHDFVRDCLESVFAETEGLSFEVIYVDNASEDGSVEMVRERFPSVRIIENSENLGFIKANNQAIEVSRGRYVLLLNSDTVVLDGAIQKTVAFTDEHPEAAVVGCRVLNPDRTLQRACFMYPSTLNTLLGATGLRQAFSRSRFFGRERMTWWDFDEVRQVQTVCGCFALVRMTAIEQVGVMDEIYFVYGDDPDWCYRFEKAGWKNLFTPDARIIHFGGQTTKQQPNKFLLQKYGTKLVFIKKYRGRLTFPFACGAQALFCVSKALQFGIVGLFDKSDRERAFKMVRTHLVGATYCLFNWKNLLMNKGAVRDQL
jgi:hypothetical protein